MSVSTEVPAAHAAGPAVAPQQFGVDGVKKERDWPLMTRAEVAAVLERYRRGPRGERIGALAELSWHSPRPFSAGALVKTVGGEALFVKRHHGYIRDVEALHEEHRFIAHLRSRGLAVVQVLRTTDGASAVAAGEWTYEVHELAAGVDVYRGTMSWMPFAHASHARAAGRTLARLHLAGADFDAPARAIRPLLQSARFLGAADLPAALEAWVQAQPRLVRALASRAWRTDIVAAVRPFHDRLVPLLPALPTCWTHGDFHASNLLWTDGAPGAQVRTVLDFGLSDRTWAVYDLALAIERNAVEWLSEPGARRVHLDQVDALLEGYESLRPLGDDEHAALLALLPIVHVEFALSEVGYFDGILASPETADIAYERYLLGHAQWFGEAEGRALLDWLAARPRGDRRAA
jgi:Ser/Thr protein kinase RdoA (MazF antagonist)